MAQQEDFTIQRSSHQELETMIHNLGKENRNLKLQNQTLSSELQKSKNTLNDFRKRMGKIVDLKLGSSGVLSEDLNNPCRESELKSMYEKISKNQWAKLLSKLHTQEMNANPERIKNKAKRLIKETFEEAESKAKKLKHVMESLVQLNNEHGNNMQTSQYFNMAIQNIQMAIYQKNMELQNMECPEVLWPLIEGCYKTGCLMALHNPPILLDWENNGEAPFPPIKSGSANQSENQVSQDHSGEKSPDDQTGHQHSQKHSRKRGHDDQIGHQHSQEYHRQRGRAQHSEGHSGTRYQERSVSGHQRSPVRSVSGHQRSPGRSVSGHQRSPGRSVSGHQRSPGRSTPGVPAYHSGGQHSQGHSRRKEEEEEEDPNSYENNCLFPWPFLRKKKKTKRMQTML